jgi:hypothetical protein
MSGDRFHLPEPPAPQPGPDAFVLVPRSCLPPQSPESEALYRWALAQAQAVARPSLPERDLLAVWN